MKNFPKTYNYTQHIYYCLNYLKEYQRYFEKNELLLAEEFEKYQNYLKDDNLYQKYGERFNWQQNHFADLSDTFPDNQRKTTFTAIFSFFEYKLNELCDLFMKRRGLSLRFTDLEGVGINRARTYLIKVASINIADSRSWGLIKDYQSIRNLIVHSNSEVDEPNDKRLKYFIKSNLIVLNNYLSYHQFSLKKEFVLDFVNHLEKYFTEVLEVVSKVKV
jgi:hypothetical protein